MPKKRQPSDLCPNHSPLSLELRRVESSRYAEKLRRALREAVNESRHEDAALSDILSHGEVFEGMEGLEMDISVLAFPDMRSGPSRSFGFTWEWIEENEEALIAEELVGQVREAMMESDLPQESSGFLSE